MKNPDFASFPPAHAGPRPVVKWVGGKRQLLKVLHMAAPTSYGRYYEPFVGGGAFLFSLLPGEATISDANPELINCYHVIRDDVDALIRNLHEYKNEAEYFYTLRSANLGKLSPVQRAGRFIYLNKTCFNGLYRENAKGQFNTPFGRYAKPKIADDENLLTVSRYFRSSGIKILNAGYQSVLESAKAGDFVYFDPPYAPLTRTANFVGYVKGGFGLEDQQELARAFSTLSARGVHVMLSNSNSEIIHDLYKDFNIQVVCASRAINCKGGSRGKDANEVLVTNR